MKTDSSPVPDLKLNQSANVTNQVKTNKQMAENQHAPHEYENGQQEHVQPPQNMPEAFMMMFNTQMQRQEQLTQRQEQLFQTLSAAQNNAINQMSASLMATQNKLPAISSNPKHFDMYTHFTCENYLNTEIKRWMETEGIADVHAPNMLCRGWPKQKETVKVIVNSARRNNPNNPLDYDMETIYRRIDRDVIHLNPSVLHSIFAGMEHKPKEKYSELLDNIKRINNVVNANLGEHARFTACKNKFREIVELDYSSTYWRNKRSRDQMLNVLRNPDFGNWTEFELKREIWCIERYHPHDFEGAPTPLQSKNSDEDMEVCAVRSSRRAVGNSKEKKLGLKNAWMRNKPKIKCPNHRCPATYLKTWCHPFKKVENGGYKFCGACATVLKVDAVHLVDESEPSDNECNLVKTEQTNEVNNKGVSNGIDTNARQKRVCPTRNSSISTDEGLVDEISDAMTVERSSDNFDTKSSKEFLRNASKQEQSQPDPSMDFRGGSPNVDYSGTPIQSRDVNQKTSEDAQNNFEQDFERGRNKEKAEKDIKPECCNNTDSSPHTTQTKPISVGIKIGTHEKMYKGQVDTGSGPSFMNPEIHRYLREHQPEAVAEIMDDCESSFTTANTTPFAILGTATVKTKLFDSVQDSKHQTIRFIIPLNMNKAFLL